MKKQVNINLTQEQVDELRDALDLMTTVDHTKQVVKKFSFTRVLIWLVILCSIQIIWKISCNV